MRRLFCLLLLAVAVPAHAVSIPNEVDWAQGTNWSFEQNFHGFAEAWVYTPDSFSAVDGRRGLVFHLIGCGQMPFQAAQAGGWPAAAEAHGLVVVIPRPLSPAHPNRDSPNVECFNYGYDGAFGVYRPTRNDPSQGAIIGAARALIDDADLAIDPNQIYIAGLSAGGATAVEVACMAPDLFAGVGTASAPGIGSAQGTAVMPPPATFSRNSVRDLCYQWADSSGVANARDLLSSQVYGIISDDNALPAGNGPFDTTKFNDQQIWDGDKFCPHIYQEIRAQAFQEVLGLGEPERGVELGRGTGIGCPGGEHSRDDGGEVRCVINDQIRRDWVALADVYRDPEGRTRMVKIEQDTLRHAWPSGPIEAPDTDATPTRDDLRADGYIIVETGEFDRTRTGNAPNGIYGTIYFNHDAIDFPMFLADLWARNNPRITDAGPGPGPQPEPMPEPEPEPAGEARVTIGSATGAANGCITVGGTADGAAQIEIVAPGLGRETIAGMGAWEWSRCDLAPGEYVVLARGVDGAGLPGEATAPSRATVPAGGGGVPAESVDGDLTEHSNAGRVVRFTPFYFELRDQYCVYENFVWSCDPFTLYRCPGDAEWTLDEPNCGGMAGEPLPTVALSQVIDGAVPEVGAGEALAVTVKVSNAGPDAASAVYLQIDSAARVEGAACVTIAGVAWCDVGAIAAGAQADVDLQLFAASGAADARIGVAGAQQAEPVVETVNWQVEAGQGEGGAGGMGGNGGDGAGGGQMPPMNEPEPSPPGEPDPAMLEPEPSERVGGNQEPEPIQLDKGCMTTPGSSPTAPLWALLIGVLVLRRSERRPR